MLLSVLTQLICCLTASSAAAALSHNTRPPPPITPNHPPSQPGSHSPPPPPSPAAAGFFHQGHDLSSQAMLESNGATFRDTAQNNKTVPVESILAGGGMNTVRLRLWVNPPAFESQPSTYDLAYTLSLASRFAARGFRIYLDFHFSDTWADPQKQYTPSGWPMELVPLAGRLREYVAATLEAFHQRGIQLDIVSLGNEIRHGMLWPLGQVDVDTQRNFTGLATLYKAARLGVSDAVARKGVKKPLIMIHIDNGWNATLQTQWFSLLTGTGLVSTADWDVMGFSFYPFYSPNATFDALRSSLDILARKYNKPLMVVETDYPVLCDGRYNPVPEFSEPEIPVSVQGQIEWTSEIVKIVKGVRNGLGRGVFYWEPAWLNNTGLGSACEDAILFDQDWSVPNKPVGYSRKSVKLFS